MIILRALRYNQIITINGDDSHFYMDNVYDRKCTEERLRDDGWYPGCPNTEELI